MATVMSDEIFKEIPYKAKSREQLLAGIDKFLDAVTVLPPGKGSCINVGVESFITVLALLHSNFKD